MLATEAFARLAKVTLDARRLPDRLAIVIKGNPELYDESRLAGLADRLLEEAATRLTTGGGSLSKMVD
jgi:hypothetical protein